MESKTTNYCANNVTWGGLSFHAWFVLRSRLHVPLSCLLFQSVPSWLPGPGRSGCSLILAYLHYITSYLNEACWETSRDIDTRHTHKIKRSRISQVSWDSFSHIHRNYYIWLLIKIHELKQLGNCWNTNNNDCKFVFSFESQKQFKGIRIQPFSVNTGSSNDTWLW